MKSNSILTFIYAAFVFIGGAIGFATAGSVPSLAMGTVFALLLAICGKLMLNNKTYAYVGAVALTAVLLAFFGYRLILTEKFMPAGLMVILSIINMSALLSSRPELKKDVK